MFLFWGFLGSSRQFQGMTLGSQRGWLVALVDDGGGDGGGDGGDDGGDDGDGGGGGQQEGWNPQKKRLLPVAREEKRAEQAKSIPHRKSYSHLGTGLRTQGPTDPRDP